MRSTACRRSCHSRSSSACSIDGQRLDGAAQARHISLARVGPILYGKRITLRPVRETDLDEVYAAHVDIRNRGSFYPLEVVSESVFRHEFAESGFWQKEYGRLLIVSAENELAGQVEFFRPVSYWDGFELAYYLYDNRFAGRGYTTEAVQLLVDYLFATKKEHRLHLVIVPENAASRRIAEKCGFTLEGTVRGAFFNAGRNNDVLLYSLLRPDPRPWHASHNDRGADQPRV